VNNPGERKHDKVEVKSVQLSADKKTVFLEITDVKPCDQMKIKFNVNAADGAPVSEEIYNTIHKVGPEKKLAAK